MILGVIFSCQQGLEVLLAAARITYTLPAEAVAADPELGLSEAEPLLQY